MTSTSLPVLQSETEKQKRERVRARKIRDFFRSLASHTVINVVGLFFLIPFVWMMFTAFKSNQDVFHAARVFRNASPIRGLHPRLNSYRRYPAKKALCVSPTPKRIDVI